MSRELLAAEQSFAAIYRTVGALENYLHLAAALLVAKDAGLQLAAGRAHLPLLLGAALAAACSGAASRKEGSSAWPASACCKRRSASAARAPATAEPPQQGWRQRLPLPPGASVHFLQDERKGTNQNPTKINGTRTRIDSN